jgi:VanZ family protein
MYLSISVGRFLLILPIFLFIARWFGFSKKTGLSPLAPGQWKGFLAVYAGFYVFNNIIRPMRLAASVGVAPYFERAVATIQRKTKLSKGVSVGIVVFLANVCGTLSLMSLGIYIASLAAGIPIFPPKV